MLNRNFGRVQSLVRMIGCLVNWKLILYSTKIINIAFNTKYFNKTGSIVVYSSR